MDYSCEVASHFYAVTRLTSLARTLASYVLWTIVGYSTIL